jgi:putative acetyltransferase
MDVREYTPGDLVAVVALFQRSVRRINSGDYSPAQIAAWAPEFPDLAAWSRRLADGGVFVCERDGEMAGFVRVDAGGCLDLLYVHPELQRQGAGRALCERAASWASSRGLRRLEAQVSITARAFFERLGFRMLGPQLVERGGMSFRNFRMELDMKPNQDVF